MHPYSLIPLLSMLTAGVLASAIAAYEPDRRANRLMSLALLCIAFWSLCGFAQNQARDAEEALFWMRLSTLGTSFLGPLALHNLLLHGAMGIGLFRRLLPVSYAAAALVAVLASRGDWLYRDARRVEWGWTPVSGPGLVPAYLLVAAIPVAAVLAWLWKRRRQPEPQAEEHRVIQVSAAVCFGLASLSDFVGPLFDLHFPRFGSTSLLAWGAIAWWSVYRQREPALAPHRYAKEILQTLPDGVALVRGDGRLRHINPRLAEMVGVEARALAGWPLTRLLAAPVRNEDPFAQADEQDLITASGARLRVAVQHTPLCDESGHAIGEVLWVRDARELATIRARLVASGRLMAMGQLTAGIAHEINNPIAYLRSNLALLRRHWARLRETPAKALSPELAPAAQIAIEAASEQVEHIAATVRDVSGLSHESAFEEPTADVGETIGVALRIASTQLRGLEIRQPSGFLPRVDCSSSELLQVVLNLLLNAAQALAGQGEIAIEARVDGDAIALDIRDNGPGIPAHQHEKIFQPFFTTRDQSRGSGLGLTLVRQIVEGAGGRIEVHSHPGDGTTFRLFLPIAAAPEGDAAGEGAPCNPAC